MSKLFVISFEGLNMDLLENWCESGRLPHFKYVQSKGHLGEIACSNVPYEASGLLSAFSGMDDFEHGVMSYWKAHNPDYVPQVWKSGEIEDHMIWRKALSRDNRVGVVNIFGTHPPRELNSALVSYAMERTLRYTYPANLLRSLSEKGLPYVQDMGAFYKGQGKNEFLSEVLRTEGMRHLLSMKLYEKALDVYFVNYTCIDRVSHFYMKELKDDSVRLEDKIIFQMYRYCDSVLGDVLKFAGRHHSDLLIFSSVGFGHLEHFVEINPMLRNENLLSYDKDGRRLDWKRTIAFESVQGSHGININRAGRYVHGIVKDSEFISTRRHVMETLGRMINPYNGNPLFSSVFPGEDRYRNGDMVPDIIIEPYDWGYLPYGDNYWADIVSRHAQTGWHRAKSVWGGLGPNISRKIDGNVRPHLANIAPTINQLLGVTEEACGKYGSLCR